jgi:hypothetical protein
MKNHTDHATDRTFCARLRSRFAQRRSSLRVRSQFNHMTIKCWRLKIERKSVPKRCRPGNFDDGPFLPHRAAHERASYSPYAVNPCSARPFPKRHSACRAGLLWRCRPPTKPRRPVNRGARVASPSRMAKSNTKALPGEGYLARRSLRAFDATPSSLHEPAMADHE